MLSQATYHVLKIETPTSCRMLAVSTDLDKLRKKAKKYLKKGWELVETPEDAVCWQKKGKTVRITPITLWEVVAHVIAITSKKEQKHDR